MNEILARVMTVIDRHYNGSRPDFARAIGKKPDTITSYVQKDSVPGGEFLATILKLGISSDWLLSGEGGMFAENQAGRALQKKANAYNAERDDNVGQVLDGFDLLESRVYTDVITEEEVNVLESLTKKLRKLV
jgi:hypothetical protein